MDLLDIQGLTVDLPMSRGAVRILHGLDLAIAPGERLGLVGESGSGKSMTALAVMGLLPEGARTGGGIRLQGQELLELDERRLARLRGREMAMVFQEPLTALDPVMTIGRQIAEGPERQLGLSRKEAMALAGRLLDRVGLPRPRFDTGLYPHQLSGGQRQRVGIAIALASAPKLLIADEPTTALDVTSQAEVLGLLDGLVAEHGMGLLLVTHDLGVVAAMTDRVAVMYAGRLVETGPTDELFAAMMHPYTRGLFEALPAEGARACQRLRAIPGQVPQAGEMFDGCPFAPRCPRVQAICHAVMPPLEPAAAAHRVACHFPLREPAS